MTTPITHSLLRAFRANKPAFGVWLTVPGFFHARAVAQAGGISQTNTGTDHTQLSWVMVDCEHGLVPLVPGVAESVAAIHGAGAASGAGNNAGPSALVRIPATGVSASTSWQIKYALDAGARGVLVPMVGRDFACALDIGF